MKGTPDTLLVNELYTSVQGEGTRAGRPCSFVRLTGCGLRCEWCDTEYAFYEGTKRSLDEVVSWLDAQRIRLVQLTGGEPLEQAAALPLIARLCDESFEVVIETGGHVDTSKVDARAILVIDVKCPGSGMEKRNFWPNFARLRPHDEVKLVIKDRRDFDYALEAIAKHGIATTLLFSPVHGVLDPKDLVAWLLEAPLPNARLNLQQHKYIWPAALRGV